MKSNLNLMLTLIFLSVYATASTWKQSPKSEDTSEANRMPAQSNPVSSNQLEAPIAVAQQPPSGNFTNFWSEYSDVLCATSSNGGGFCDIVDPSKEGKEIFALNPDVKYLPPIQALRRTTSGKSYAIIGGQFAETNGCTSYSGCGAYREKYELLKNFFQQSENVAWVQNFVNLPSRTGPSFYRKIIFCAKIENELRCIEDDPVAVHSFKLPDQAAQQSHQIAFLIGGRGIYGNVSDSLNGGPAENYDDYGYCAIANRKIVCRSFNLNKNPEPYITTRSFARIEAQFPEDDYTHVFPFMRDDGGSVCAATSSQIRCTIVGSSTQYSTRGYNFSARLENGAIRSVSKLPANWGTHPVFCYSTTHDLLECRGSGLQILVSRKEPGIDLVELHGTKRQRVCFSFKALQGRDRVSCLRIRGQ